MLAADGMLLFLGLPDDLVPWMAIANNSYGHYREHEPDLRAWLAQTV